MSDVEIRAPNLFSSGDNFCGPPRVIFCDRPIFHLLVKNYIPKYDPVLKCRPPYFSVSQWRASTSLFSLR